MSISLSNAAAAAKAAKADLGAPVAANNGQSDSAATTRANGNGNNNVAKQNAAADNSKSTRQPDAGQARPEQSAGPWPCRPGRPPRTASASNDAAAPADDAPMPPRPVAPRCSPSC
jgi:flagellar hook-length control protein FliK